MPKDYPRSQRVAEQLQRALGTLITCELKDPRVHLATVTEVEVSRDLSHAKVYIGVLEMAADPVEVIRGLRHSARFLRARLGRSLHMRYVPELRFIEDTTERDAQRISSLIDQAVAQDQQHDHADKSGSDSDLEDEPPQPRGDG